MALVTLQRSPTPSAASTASTTTTNAGEDFGSDDDRRLNRERMFPRTASLSNAADPVEGGLRHLRKPSLFVLAGRPVASHCKRPPDHQRGSARGTVHHLGGAEPPVTSNRPSARG
ncbi:hypothetical protein SKAU_G00001510 [Synaphobranchus kaupii]|uniref:Uncharacterized protein n=1 Tax=Synaphobranchus kaupii TaxID=118154 RepID=A0A9Q1G976_SYNKA|nr:hypothetical protein SKAU_G00001510 [Synaphobranchus kaupii]